MRCLFLLLFVLTLSAAEKKGSSLPPHKTETFTVAKDIPYADDATGLSFPVRFGNFEKWMVRRNQHPLIGTVIRYSDPDSGSGDISIYQLDAEGEQDITSEQTRAEWERLRQSMRQLETFRSFCLQEQGTVLAGGKEIGCFTGGRLDIRGKSCFSEMLLVARKDRQIRIRVTVSAEKASASRQFTKDVLQFLFAGEKIAMQKTAQSGK